MAQQSHKAAKPQSHNKAQQRMATKILHDIILTYLRSTTVLNKSNSPNCPCSFVSIELEKDNSDSSAKKWLDGTKCRLYPRLNVKPN